MRTLLVVLLSSFLFAATAFAAPDGGPRIRPQDDRTTAALAAGAARSASFRDLMTRIERSSVIAYISVSPLLKPAVAGHVTWMTVAGGYRYLRVSINRDQTFDQMISTLAHELQHVVEVIEHPAVVDEASLTTLYQRIGRPSRATTNSGWDTTAAQEMGVRVKRELVATPTIAALRASDDDKL
jgi:hypothetical protein